MKTVHSFTWDIGVNGLNLMSSDVPYNLVVSAEVSKPWKPVLQRGMGMLSGQGRFSLV